jgi:small subunit ribosomal protein S1
MMNDENSNQESFADLFNEKDLNRDRLTPGQKISTVVVGITPENIFLDVGGKNEGCLDRKELEDEEGNVSIQIGDTVEAYFLSEAKNEMLFTTKIGAGPASRAFLEEAYRSGIPLEGFVQKEIKGGFEVTVSGNIRTFCPFSQMDLRRISNAEDYIGQHLLFKIMEYGEGDRNIILSHRIILEEERLQKREALQESLQEGKTVQGTITSIRDFGAFVDLGGIEGLIPISEIGWGQVADIHDILSEDQEVEVVVMKLDWENDRFSFSLKQALPDPWTDINRKFPVGSEQTGTIVRLTKFGAFVNLAAGIDGLVHISKLGAGRRINHPREVVEEGQSVEVRIEDIDAEQKRIALTLVSDEAEEDTDSESNAEDYRKYTQQPAEQSNKQSSIGTLGDILQAKLKEKEKKK